MIESGGNRVGNFEIMINRENLLGQGSFAKVFKAKDLTDGTIVAVKIMDKKLWSRTPQLHGYFKFELETMQKIRLWEEPFFVKLIKHVSDEDFEYIFMEYCERDLLEESLFREIDVPEILEMIFQIGLGVKKLHSENIIHRDLKLQNILVKGSTCKIIDFGLSTGKISPSTLLGTMYYVAPEIIQGNRRYDNRVDIWALNTLLYKLLTKEFYFTGNDAFKLRTNIMEQTFQVGFPFNKSWSVDLIELLKRGFTKDFEQRPTIEEYLSFPVFKTLRKKYGHYFPAGKEGAKSVFQDSVKDSNLEKSQDPEATFKFTSYHFDSKAQSIQTNDIHGATVLNLAPKREFEWGSSFEVLCMGSEAEGEDGTLENGSKKETIDGPRQDEEEEEEIKERDEETKFISVSEPILLNKESTFKDKLTKKESNFYQEPNQDFMTTIISNCNKMSDARKPSKTPEQKLDSQSFKDILKPQKFKKLIRVIQKIEVYKSLFLIVKERHSALSLLCFKEHCILLMNFKELLDKVSENNPNKYFCFKPESLQTRRQFAETEDYRTILEIATKLMSNRLGSFIQWIGKIRRNKTNKRVMGTVQMADFDLEIDTSGMMRNQIRKLDFKAHNITVGELLREIEEFEDQMPFSVEDLC